MNEEKEKRLNLDELAMNARRTLGIYMPFQIKTMEEMYGGHESARKNTENWEKLYSPEFEEVFLLEVKKQLQDHPELIGGLAVEDLLSPKNMEKKVEALHKLEQALMLNMEKGLSFEGGFVRWHEIYSRKILHIIHENPNFLEIFLNKDRTNEEKGEVINFVRTELKREDLEDSQ